MQTSHNRTIEHLMPPEAVTSDEPFMRRAIELARRGEGHVEPNPMVGCVLVRGERIVGEGWHQRYGGPHAEIEALRAAGEAARGATAYVSLEPCCHHGKTPPCTAALIAAGVERAVVAVLDPFPAVSGGGVSALAQAGIATMVGCCEKEARRLLAPYLKRVTTGRPWVIGKWAMSLDGKIATFIGDSKWITSESSRGLVHALRGRVDGILVGRRTAERDDPLLTARPPGPRTAVRIILDSRASLATTSRLVQTIDKAPVLVAVSEEAPQDACDQLGEAGVDVVRCPGSTFGERLTWLLQELGRRRMTNVLVEGGGVVLGTLLDLREIDEVHAFIAPKLVGGAAALSPLAGGGISAVADALQLVDVTVRTLEGDVMISGRVD
jgi:diaminohydroxyphosphoribosylaminopyrimidine deaminase/5-amino-6-(5-phosphoribosylamino)uracil reductase